MDIDINDKEFGLFQRLIYNESGINLTPAKKRIIEISFNEAFTGKIAGFI